MSLKLLIEKGFNLVNLTLEDFIIADVQGIHFEDYSLNFLNSSVIDLTEDGLVTKKNIFPIFNKSNISFIGLSDDSLDPSLPKEKFIINDYVLSILKIKRNALKENPNSLANSYVIIHNMGKDIEQVMDRLPSTFKNSLAN